MGKVLSESWRRGKIGSSMSDMLSGRAKVLAREPEPSSRLMTLFLQCCFLAGASAPLSEVRGKVRGGKAIEIGDDMFLQVCEVKT